MYDWGTPSRNPASQAMVSESVFLLAPETENFSDHIKDRKFSTIFNRARPHVREPNGLAVASTAASPDEHLTTWRSHVR
jgi:hypothetical protein